MSEVSRGVGRRVWEGGVRQVSVIPAVSHPPPRLDAQPASLEWTVAVPVTAVPGPL